MSSTSSGGSASCGMPGTKASAVPARSSRIAGATLTRRAKTAVPASTASRIRKIRNLASTIAPRTRHARASEGRRRFTSTRVKSDSLASQEKELSHSLAQIVAVGFRDDAPAVGKFHRHQIVGEIAWWDLAAHLDEGGVLVGV